MSDVGGGFWSWFGTDWTVTITMMLSVRTGCHRRHFTVWRFVVVTAIQVGLDELTSISRSMLSAICHDVDAYAALDESIKRDLVSVNVRNAQLFLQVADQRRMPTDAQLDVLAAAARQRFRQGVPLPSLLRAYRIGGHQMWKRVSHDRPDLDQHVLTDTTLCYIECASTVAEHAYTAEQHDMINSRAESTRMLLSRLARDDFETETDRRDAIRMLGLDLGHPHVAVIIGVAGITANSNEDSVADLVDDIGGLLPVVAGAPLPQGAIALVPATHSGGMSAVLAGAMRRRPVPDAAVTVGIGRPATGEDGLLATMREAQRARVVGEILFPNRLVYEYDTMRGYDLFRHDAAVDEFVDSVLADFARHDEESRGELIRTLHVYFTLGMNRRAAASQLGIHPNTLDHRLRKASQVGGIAVTDPELSFRFQLAIRLLPMSARKSWLTDLR
jgi:sugar diacid utilization regulator